MVAVSLRGAPVQFAAGIGAALLFATMTVLSSVVVGRVTDQVIRPTLEDGLDVGNALWLGVLAIIGVGVFKALGVFGRRFGAYTAQYHLQATYRRRVTRKYLELPVAWHRRHTTGELLSNANADIEAAFFLAAPLPMSIAAAAMLAITAALLIVTDPLLAIIGFVAGPLLAGVNSYFARRMRHAATLAQQSRADVSALAHESFDAAIVVKTMGREAAESERFRARAEQLRDRMIRFATVRAKFDPLMEGLPTLAILAVLWVGARRVEVGALTPGDLVQFAYLFRLVAIPIRVFGWLLGELPRAIVGYDRVDRVLQAEGSTDYGTVTPEGEGGMPVTTSGLTYMHPTDAHSDVSGSADDELAAALGLEERRESGKSGDTKFTTEDDTRGVEGLSLIHI